MLKYFVIITTILALVAPARGTNADADGDKECGMLETVRLGANVGKVLRKSGEIVSCTSASGFNMLTASVLPSPDVMAKICDTPACGSAIGGLDGLDLPDCVLNVPLFDANLNFAKLLEDYQSACSDSSTSDSASGSTSDSASTSDEDDESDEDEDKDEDDELDEDDDEDEDYEPDEDDDEDEDNELEEDEGKDGGV